MMTSYSRSESSMTIETRSDPIDASLLRGERPSLPGTVLTTRQVNNFGFRRLSRLRHASSTQASSAEPLPFTFSSLFRRATNLKANLVGQDEEELGTGKSQDHGKEPGTRERARNTGKSQERERARNQERGACRCGVEGVQRLCGKGTRQNEHTGVQPRTTEYNRCPSDPSGPWSSLQMCASAQLSGGNQGVGWVWGERGFRGGRGGTIVEKEADQGGSSG